MPLGDCEIGAKVRILRFENEAEDLLHYLKHAGLEVALTGAVTAKDDEHLTVTSDAGDEVTLTASVAETVSVTADPSPPARTALPDQLVIGEHRYGR